nr:hypothetical protein [Tolivirales sp.]
MPRKNKQNVTQGGPAKAASPSSTKSRRQRNPNKKKTTIPRALVESVCSVVDPFCPHAFGAKAFDISNARTVPFTTRFLTSFTADSSGNGAMFISPYAHYQITLGTLSGSAFTVANSSYALGAPLPGVADKYRLVSMGVIIRCVGSVLNRSGAVYVRLFGTSTTSLSPVDLRTFNANECYEYPITAGADPIYVVNRKISLTADQFSPVDTETSFVNFADNGWSNIFVSTYGAEASKIALEIECIYHWELIIKDDQNMQQLATPTRAPNSIVGRAVALVGDKTTAAVQVAADKVGDWFVKKAIMGLAGAVGGAFGGPQGAIMGAGSARMIMDVD